MALRLGTPGNDDLVGTAGDDTFIGGAGDDTATGGDGGDAFVYQSLSDLSVWTGAIATTRETITDFGEQGQVIESGEADILDFSALTSFQFMGDDAFTASGRDEFRFERRDDDSLLMLFDAGGDGAADRYLVLDRYVGAGSRDESFVDQPVITNVIISADLFAYHYRVGLETDDVLVGTDPATDPEALSTDRIYGFAGNDRLYSRGGSDDELYGGEGNDRLFSNRRGTAIMEGGNGDDAYFVYSEFDQVIEAAGGGTDTVNSTSDYVFLTANVENLNLLAGGVTGSGNGLDNIINGNDGANVLNGNAGDDALSGGGGTDYVSGGLGDDWMRGGAGGDYLVGGAGSDKFVYYTASEAGFGADRDVITDFQGLGSGTAQRDRIDLRRIDADTSTAFDDAFRLIGAGAFTGRAGELRVVAAEILVVDPTPPPYADPPVTAPGFLVEGDVDGNGTADFQIGVVSAAALRAPDFLL
ncbi:calcium-binding protein [Methylobacterium oryzihabitans]|uniref:Calcium-binding protein n=1 Tax=Methylobacterium oryzihabitans TaxID=2499852 RepID=A0A3S3U464_9HYPH|nr:calcium-binding protein [Methylobacterium oryzihabitans]RVU15196.1 calcium-binding protein [Methylobacterium oryzihabitans]